MSAWTALFWGGASSGALFIGQALAKPLEREIKATGLLMAFGAGTLLSAIAYELIPDSTFDGGPGVAMAFVLGALTYYGGDALLDRAGGAARSDLDQTADEGTGAALFLGAMLDGLPEAFILGIGISMGAGVSVAFVAAVIVSNVPQGVAGTVSLRQSGTRERTITVMWGGLSASCALVAVLGFALADSIPNHGIHAQAFAAGAVLVMLADSMMPEAFEHGGRAAGLLTVLGFLAAALLSAAA